jgi:hypothetical protein
MTLLDQLKALTPTEGEWDESFLDLYINDKYVACLDLMESDDRTLITLAPLMREELLKMEGNDRFTQGYMCAMAAMMQKTGETTPLVETVSENYTTISDLKKQGVVQEDIDTLRPIFKEINRKRKLNTPTQP